MDLILKKCEYLGGTVWSQKHKPNCLRIIHFSDINNDNCTAKIIHFDDFGRKLLHCVVSHAVAENCTICETQYTFNIDRSMGAYPITSERHHTERRQTETCKYFEPRGVSSIYVSSRDVWSAGNCSGKFQLYGFLLWIWCWLLSRWPIPDCSTDQVGFPVHHLTDEHRDLYTAYQGALKCYHQTIDDVAKMDETCRGTIKEFEGAFKRLKAGNNSQMCPHFDEFVSERSNSLLNCVWKMLNSSKILSN